MIKDIGPRQNGKTSRLIQLSHETGLYIMAPTRAQAAFIFQQAKKMGLDIHNPVAVIDYMNTRFAGSYIRRQGLLVDNADAVLQALMPEIEIKAMTMTYPDPWEEAASI